MCPNHVENFIDSTLVSSTSLTERLKLWSKYGGSKSGSGSNFNPDSIKLEFFRKVRKGKLYERGVNRARVIKRDQRIRVPQYIKVWLFLNNQKTLNNLALPIYIDSIIFCLILIDLRKFAESLPESNQRFIRRTGHTTITSFRPNYSWYEQFPRDKLFFRFPIKW